MKKSILVLIFAMFCLTSIYSRGEDESAISVTEITADNSNIVIKSEQPMISSLVHDPDRTWISYKNRPYLNYGVQLSVADIITEEFNADVDLVLDSYYGKAAELGFRTVVVPLPWNYIEVEKDVYNFERYLDKLIFYSEKYNLTLQLLWFGSNVCGWPTLAPEYILNDYETYPRVAGPVKEWASFNFNNSQLLEREMTVLYATMEHISEVDINKRVMMIQIENEADNFSQMMKNWRDWEKYIWVGGQKDEICYFMDQLGQIVHKSSHPILTRFNAVGVNDQAEHILRLDGIDMVGRNLYVYDLRDENSQYSFLNLTSAYNYDGNANHTAENGGQYTQNINLILSALSRGQGYLIYELRTINREEYDFGIYRKTDNPDEWIERDGTLQIQYEHGPSGEFFSEGITQEIRDLNQMLYKVDKKIAFLPPQNMADYNRLNSNGRVNETNQVGSRSVTFRSDNGGEALVLEDTNGDVYLLATKENSLFYIEGLNNDAVISAGYFNHNEEWITERVIALDSEGMVKLNSYEVVRVLP